MREGWSGLESDPGPNSVMFLVAYKFIFVSGNLYSAKKSEITTPAISCVLIEREHILSSVAM